MAEGNKNFFLQLFQVFKELPTGRKISFTVTALLLVVGFAVLLYWANRPNYQALFTNLDAADAGKIIDKLNEKKIPYLLKEGGGAVFVPDDMVYQLRLEMASAGIPKGQNVGFEIFDNVGFGTTEFVQRLKYQQALQGELARTIMQFDAIAQARVHIVAAGDSLFAEPEKPATASVVLRMKQGRFLDQQQLQGIINLVSCAVEGLKPQNVSVVDMAGGLLSKGHDEDDVGVLTRAQLDYRQKMERTLESRIQTMLEPVVGVNKVVARVAAEVDFGQVSILEEKYDPASAAVRSEQRQKETANGTKSLPSGSPDLQTQLIPDQGGAAASESAKNYQRENSVINYEINKVNRQTKSAVGDVKRLSAAVIIDGPYVAEKGADNKTIQKFAPRSKRELKNLEDVIKKAIGFNEERGDQVNVSNIAFAMEEETPVLAEEGGAPFMDYLKKFGKPVFNIALVLIFLLIVVRPFKRWLSQSTEYLSSRPSLPVDNQTVALPTGIEEAVTGRQSKERVLEMTRNSPDMAADIIKNWINESR